MKKSIRTAVDLGKNYFQFHGLASEGGVMADYVAANPPCGLIVFAGLDPAIHPLRNDS
jgi:hypothetical protein